ncbi:MAG: 3-phosphoshikimate 1-carboxyvinyltransferase [Coriobacteriia bacterium]|nr:3-phosphoshikimate 1-carboxyvinyltransferase [Coriobacteriia bacterium]
MDARVSRATVCLSGDIHVPGDKSISHRAVLFAGMAEGESRLLGVLDSEDVRSTIAAVTSLGAEVAEEGSGSMGLRFVVRGWGESGPKEPAEPLFCGNSGTTARLVLGALAGWPVPVTLAGDSSLSRRPMLRVCVPLRAMGASIDASDNGTLPVRMVGGDLVPIDYVSPVASAQVKSAILLAGLRAAGTTRVAEPVLSRDHTERMLPAFGVMCDRDNQTTSVSVTGPVTLLGADVVVPGDPSSAAFLAVAAAIVPGSAIRILNVAVNPTRTGFLKVLTRMGVDHSVDEVRFREGEPLGTLSVRYSKGVAATRVVAEEAPSLIDEVPILALLATQADGVTRFEGISELRVKESDRLEAIRSGLAAFGADVTAGPDWLEVKGPSCLQGTTVDSLGDHRLAMTWAIAGLVAEGTSVVRSFEAVEVSYPRFLEDVVSLMGGGQ